MPSRTDHPPATACAIVVSNDIVLSVALQAAVRMAKEKSKLHKFRHFGRESKRSKVSSEALSPKPLAFPASQASDFYPLLNNDSIVTRKW